VIRNLYHPQRIPIADMEDIVSYGEHIGTERRLGHSPHCGRVRLLDWEFACLAPVWISGSRWARASVAWFEVWQKAASRVYGWFLRCFEVVRGAVFGPATTLGRHGSSGELARRMCLAYGSGCGLSRCFRSRMTRRHDFVSAGFVFAGLAGALATRFQG